MSTYRGFDKHLISRATRAEGDKHYFNERTLQYFDAYGGKWLDSGPDHVTLVDSIRDTFSDSPRQYRVIRVHFTRDAIGWERVAIERATNNYPSARQAIAAYRTTREV